MTTPLRTVVDLARFGTSFDEQLVLRLLAFGGITVADCLDAMDRRRNLPGKRRVALAAAWRCVRASSRS